MQAYAAYVQDQWQRHARPDVELRLCAGSTTRGRRAAGASASPASIRMTATSIPADWRTCRSTPVSISDPGEFLPRIGAAYRLGDKTVLRAGYGQSADPKPYIDFRNAYPINFAWSHPQVTFNGVDQCLHSGHDVASRARTRRPSRSAPISRRASPPAAGRRARRRFRRPTVRSAHSLVEPGGSSASCRTASPAQVGLRRDAGERPAGVRQHQRRTSRHRERRPAAGAVRHYCRTST